MLSVRNTALFAARAMTLWLPTGARADIVASARISGFFIELVDLAPGDGTAPSLILAGGRSFVTGVAVGGLGFAVDGSRYSEGAFGEIAASYAAGGAGISLSVFGAAGGPPWADATLRADGVLTGSSVAGTTRYFSGAASSNGDFFSGYSLLLSPGTSVSIRGEARLVLSKTVGEIPIGQGGEAGVVQASFYLLGPGLENGMTAGLRLGSDDAAQALARTAVLQAFAINPGNMPMPMPLRFRASMTIDGTDQYVLVPEPASGALLDPGVAALVLLARRRGAIQRPV